VGIACQIVEMNPVTVREEARQGAPIIYGDATLPAILEHVGIHGARVMAVVVSDPTAVRRIVEVARRGNPALHLVVRTRFVTEVEPLLALGADDVVAEEFETSVEVFTRVMAHCLVPQEEIVAFTDTVRSEGYAILRQPAPGTASLDALRAHVPNLDVVGLTVAPGAIVDGMTLVEADLRRTYEITVLATRRGQRMVTNPQGTWRLAASDVVWLFGEREAVTRATDLFRPRPAPGADEPIVTARRLRDRDLPS
jgi:CPA2 family monovalent cation:H+ antiporter-2